MEAKAIGILTEKCNNGSITLAQMDAFVTEARVAGTDENTRIDFTLGYSSGYSLGCDVVKSISVPIPASLDLYAGPSVPPPPPTEPWKPVPAKKGRKYGNIALVLAPTALVIIMIVLLIGML